MSEEITTIDTSSFKNKIESLNGKKVRINYSNNTYYEGIVKDGELKEGTIYINGKNYKVENSKIKDDIKLKEGTIYINGKNYKVENSKIKDDIKLYNGIKIGKSEANLYIDDGLNIKISNQDEENGLGFILYSDGDIYEGEFLDGKQNGYGIIKAITNNEIEESFLKMINLNMV